MQGLAEDYQINALGVNRRVLQVAMPELQVLQAILLRLRRAERHYLLRIIDGDHPLASPGQQLAQESFAGAEVGHHQRRQYPHQQVAERLPGPARTINPVESPRDLVEIDLRLFASAVEYSFQVD